MGGYPAFFGRTIARVFGVFALYRALVVCLGTLKGATTPRQPTRTGALARTGRYLSCRKKTISGGKIGGIGSGGASMMLQTITGASNRWKPKSV